MIGLMEELARVAPPLAVARADARTLRGAILANGDPAAATRAFTEALDLFAAMKDDVVVQRTMEFHLRFGDLLLNLAAFSRDVRGADGAGRLLPRAVSLYLDIADSIVASGGTADARTALETIESVLASVREPERSRLAGRHRELTATLGRGSAHP
jgi:hypothetical protein